MISVKFYIIYLLRSMTGAALTVHNFYDRIIVNADVAELADAPVLGTGPNGCRFDPCHPHQN